MTLPSVFLDGRVALYGGDCFDILGDLDPCSVDAIVSDPPYHLGFMGKKWDGGDIAFRPALWRKVLRVLKPGGHVVAFSGTRTYHRMAVAIEDAGFEIRDQLAWTYGSGFPKSHDVSKAIDKAQVGVVRGRAGRAGNSFGQEYERNPKEPPISDDAQKWEGWGTALKPAWEPICFARKPLIGTVAENVLVHGVGALNIDDCRVHAFDAVGYAYTVARTAPGATQNATGRTKFEDGTTFSGETKDGRWPANIVHDGSDEVLAGFPETGAGGFPTSRGQGGIGNDGHRGQIDLVAARTDAGSAARFFYTAKAGVDDRLGSNHPTVKPVDLMRWLVRLICPKGGLVLDPFAGTGTTGQAAFLEGCDAVLIEREAEYRTDIARRMALVLAGPDERAHAIVKAKDVVEDAGPLFGGLL